MKLALKTVTVSRKHITTGKCGSPQKCAVALALAEKVGPGTSVYVNGQTASYRTGRRGVPALIVELPERVQDFIDRFDHASYGGTIPKPIRFTTAVPAGGKR